MKKEKSAGAVLVFIDTEPDYLLLLRPPSHWDFPKGHGEKGETDEDTAHREILEETGIGDVSILPNFQQKIQYFFKQDNLLISKEVVFFIAVTKTKNVRLSSEHTDYTWLAYKEALEKITFKNSKDILTKAHQFLLQRKKDGHNRIA